MGLEWTGDPAEVGDARMYLLLDRFSTAIHGVRRACTGGHERAGFEVLERQAAALERIGDALQVLGDRMDSDGFGELLTVLAGQFDEHAGVVPARTGE